ncbi:MAG: tail fiber protein [Dysgonomonas sp.]
MDKINFLAQDSFPVSTDTLNRLQNSTGMVAALALLGGSNYILSGCLEKEGKIEPGMIVFNGEILPFQGGAPLEFVEVQETKIELEAFDDLYPEAYIDRIVVFAELGKYKWENMKRVVTNQELDQKINNIQGESPGFVKMWSGRIDRLDDIYMLADGRLMKTAEFPELARYYGMEGNESFNLPNLAGLFIVGYDPQNTDYNVIGNTGGNEEIILKSTQMPRHSHPYTDDTNAAGKYPQIEAGFPTSITGIANVKSSAESSGWGTVYDTGKVGGNIDGSIDPIDVRPRFYTLAYVVKVKY